jgi:hypothetical protein
MSLTGDDSHKGPSGATGDRYDGFPQFSQPLTHTGRFRDSEADLGANELGGAGSVSLTRDCRVRARRRAARIPRMSCVATGCVVRPASRVAGQSTPAHLLGVASVWHLDGGRSEGAESAITGVLRLRRRVTRRPGRSLVEPQAFPRRLRATLPATGRHHTPLVAPDRPPNPLPVGSSIGPFWDIL